MFKKIKLSVRVKIKPEIDKISVISVQDKNVFFIESPKY